MKANNWTAAVLLLLCCAMVGCGGSNNTTTTCPADTLSVFPQSVTLTHGVAGDTQQFGASLIVPTCTTATPTPTPTPSPSATPTPTPIPPFSITWSTTDPTDVPISNNHDTTNGTATCVNPTHIPVTVIATLPASTLTNNLVVTGNATINCN